MSTPYHFSKIKKLELYITAPKSGAGFTLLEVMAAIFVVTVGLVGVSTIIQNLSSQASFSSNKLIASYLAQDGMEIIRNIRDTNWLERYNPEKSDNLWDEGFTGCSSGCEVEVDYFCTTVEEPSITDPSDHHCLNSYDAGSFLKIDTNGFYNYALGVDTKFKRKMTITKEGNDVLRVEALISWQERGKNYEFEALEKLYNWQ